MRKSKAERRRAQAKRRQNNKRVNPLVIDRTPNENGSYCANFKDPNEAFALGLLIGTASTWFGDGGKK